MCRVVGITDVNDASASSSFFGLLFPTPASPSLSTDVVELCMRSRALDGGFTPLDDLVTALRARRPRERISADDVERAVDSLAVLGGGIRLLTLDGGRRLVQSVPQLLSSDANVVLSAVAAAGGVITAEALAKAHSWSADRAAEALRPFVQDGVAWLDRDDAGRQRYWFISLCKR